MSERSDRRKLCKGTPRSAQRRAYLEGRARRKYGFSVLIDRRSQEPVAIARNGCFGSLEIDPDLYAEWAQGTTRDHRFV